MFDVEVGSELDVGWWVLGGVRVGEKKSRSIIYIKYKNLKEKKRSGREKQKI